MIESNNNEWLKSFYKQYIMSLESTGNKFNFSNHSVTEWTSKNLIYIQNYVIKEAATELPCYINKVK